jgi:phenylpropionate dioxygenase-like ring-hydroxylating dioxygenase large terminal subunit
MITKERIDELVQMADHGRIDISLYTDEEIFEAEMQRIFYTTWVYVGHSSEIAQAGDYKTTYIGRIPVIVSRDENGEIHVLINRCAHRGPTVCQQEYGNANFFRCEYHGWVYGNDGSLAGVSLRRGFGPGEIDDIQGGLDRAARVDTYRGLIFASLAEEGPTLQEHLGLSRQYLDDWADHSPTGEVMLAGGVWKHTYLGNWKLQLEGSNEGYHPQYLHKIGRLVAERVSLAGEQLRASAESASMQAHRAYGNRGGRGGTNQYNNVSSAGIDLGNGHSVMGSVYTEDSYKNMNPDYVEALRQRLGEDRMKFVLGTGWRMQLFPNAAFSTGNLRVIRPISVDRTEIMQWVVLHPGVTDQMTARTIAGEQRGYGPSGYTSVDDIEMFARMFEGYRSSELKSLNQWALFSRGQTFEKRGPNGEKFGHVTTEVEQRAIYYAWAALMKGESHVVNIEPAASPTAVAAREAATTLKSGA